MIFTEFDPPQGDRFDADETEYVVLCDQVALLVSSQYT